MLDEKIMIVDDDKKIVFAFRKTFEEYQVLSASNGVEALAMISKEQPDLIFMDIAMPKMDGLEALQRIKAQGIETPVVIITGYGAMRNAIRAIQLGAYEYLSKPLDINRIRVIAKRAIEMVKLRRELNVLKAQLRPEYQENEIIGQDPQMEEVYKTIGAVTGTPNSTNVLICGESGTGKELVAKAIHYNGQFAGEPFIAVNCTAIPETLLESELFGHERGAFTGAVEQRIGKFELAGKGTIFLDEIGYLSLNLQQKFLRVLQERSFNRIGGNRPISVTARFIAATNKNLEKAIQKNEFRKDLFFRLNVISINLPPLHKRRDDIPLLIDYFLVKYNAKMGKTIKGISAEAMERLTQYHYPGNVRELENAIERAVTLEKGEVILPESLPDKIRNHQMAPPWPLPITSPILKEARHNLLESFEKQFVIERLKSTGGSVTRAAREARVTRQSLQRMMRKYGICSEDFRKK